MKLKILEAYTRDVRRNVARIDYDTMDKLGVCTGDTVSVRSDRGVIIAKCMPLYPSDEGKRMVRIDGRQRNNIFTAIGDTVRVKRSSESQDIVPMTDRELIQHIGNGLRHVVQEIDGLRDRLVELENRAKGSEP